MNPINKKIFFAALFSLFGAQIFYALSYINTKFFHFMLTLHKDTQDCLKKTYFYVPMQDFSISWTDKILYEKYKLTEKEIEYIEKLIRQDVGGEEND